MITKEEFIATSVKNQAADTGDVALSLDETVLGHAKAVSSGMALFWDNDAQAPSNFNGWQFVEGTLRKTGGKVNRAKTAGALFSILDHKPNYSFIVDMADHRARSLVSENGTAAPVFCFNRPVDKPHGRILWPLPGYQDHGSDEYLGGPNLREIPWEQKKPVVAWRGSAGGWARLGKHGRGRMIRMHALLNKYLAGDFDQEEVERALLTVSRHRFIEVCHTDPRFDLGYTHFGPYDFDKMPLVGKFAADRIPRHEFGRFKYLAVLPGADVGSNFYWVMNSNSLGLVMTPEFDSFATHHFRPWEHYVPFRRDLRDLERNLNWCEQHPDECQEMIRRANEVCALLADGELRLLVLGKVVQRVAQQLQS